MAEFWFDPNVIRGDIESTLTGFFYPPVFSATVAYQQGDLVRLNGLVFQAPSALTGVIPPATPWEEKGRALPIVYENVESPLGQQGAIRLQISWLDTSNESIGCGEGSLRSIDGVLSCWIFSPKNAGTAIGLKDAMRLRQILNLWKRVSDCGQQIRVYSVNGPRPSSGPQGSDFYTHIVSCSLVAMERIQTLR